MLFRVCGGVLPLLALAAGSTDASEHARLTSDAFVISNDGVLSPEPPLKRKSDGGVDPKPHLNMVRQDQQPNALARGIVGQGSPPVHETLSRSDQDSRDQVAAAHSGWQGGGEGGMSATEYCQQRGMGEGEIIGTAIACQGQCQSCGRNRACVAVEKDVVKDGVAASGTTITEYGKGCWSGYKVLCCKLLEAPADNAGDPDHITVLTFNTYLKDVFGNFAKEPDYAHRGAEIAKWFESLQSGEVPDVVVLQDIFSATAEKMVQQLCVQDWVKNNDNVKFGTSAGWLKRCGPKSQFEFATSVVGPTAKLNPQKGGGTMVLTRRNIRVVEFYDEVYQQAGGSDKLMNKGFFAVRLLKGSQKYWVFGTDLQAGDSAISKEQMSVMFKKVKELAGPKEAKERILYAGTLNEAIKEMTASSLEPWGERVSSGFWLPMDIPVDNSRDSSKNHYVDSKEGQSHVDMILPGGENVTLPQKLRYQIVPVKSDKCFASESGGGCDDLSDHFGVFASICYKASGDCPVTPVKGHRGSNTSSFPSASKTCPPSVFPQFAESKGSRVTLMSFPFAVSILMICLDPQ